MRRFWLLLFLVFFASCHFYLSEDEQTQRLVNNELSTINWNDVDKYPIFDACDETATKSIQRICFQEEMMKQFKVAMTKVSFEVEQQIQDTVHVEFKIDEDGFITITGISGDETLENRLPQLRKSVAGLINDSTTVAPALKRGIPVSMKFRLPIVIDTEN